MVDQLVEADDFVLLAELKRYHLINYGLSKKGVRLNHAYEGVLSPPEREKDQRLHALRRRS